LQKIMIYIKTKKKKKKKFFDTYSMYFT